MRRHFDLKAVAVSGLAAGAAFVTVLEADLRLAGRNVDDLMVLGRPFVANPAKARAVGGVIHAINSLVLAGLYATLERRFRGPGWLKGLLFANVENVILYPITRFEDIHPAIRTGQVDRYFNWPAFWQSLPRHIAFGAVLGVVYDQLRRWDASAPD
jgi:hypothetical protein